LEIKASKAQDKDIVQLEKYVAELGEECIAGVLIAKEFPRRIIQKAAREGSSTLRLVTHSLSDFSPNECYTFEQLKERIMLASETLLPST
jgi:RecB family endonuclease NucS